MRFKIERTPAWLERLRNRPRGPDTLKVEIEIPNNRTGDIWFAKVLDGSRQYWDLKHLVIFITRGPYCKSEFHLNYFEDKNTRDPHTLRILIKQNHPLRYRYRDP